MRDPALWDRLQAYSFDAPGASRPFSRKLGRLQGWNRAQTDAAIGEYRRFLYLAAVSPDPVTPSRAVDAVWHLHLTYTHEYWDRLCGEVLGGALHHEPSAGPEENDRFAAQYARTLRLYAEEFGAPPPRRYWPGARPQAAGARAPALAGRLLRAGAIFAALFLGLQWLDPFGWGAAVNAFAALAAMVALIGVANASSGDGGLSLHFGDCGGGDCSGGCGD